MLDRHDERTITAKVSTVLEALHRHRTEHQVMLEEAREGYCEKAAAALAARIDLLKSNKPVDLSFKLSPPRNYTDQFDNIITMLTLHQESGAETVELKAIDVRRFVQGEWDWYDNFLVANAAYSETSTRAAMGKGLL